MDPDGQEINIDLDDNVRLELTLLRYNSFSFRPELSQLGRNSLVKDRFAVKKKLASSGL